MKHLEKKKSYLLLELMDQKFAIQTNSDTAIVKKNPSLKIKYKLFGGKVMHGLKVKTAVVTRDDLGEPRKILYTKQIRPDLLDVYDGIKGLPVDYYVANPDGVLHYRLVSCTPYKVDRQIFGIPSDYQITTFDNFLKTIRQE